MKVSVFLGVLVVVLCGSARAAREDFKLTGFVDDQIRKIIESIRKSIPEPLNINHFNYKAPEDTMVSGFLNASEVQLSGLTKFNITNLDVHIFGMQMEFGFMFNHLNVYLDYVTDMIFANLLPFYGNGRANVHISNLNVTGSGKVSLSPLGIKNLTLFVDLDNASFDLHGVINNEEFSAVASALLNDVVPPFIKEHQALVSKVISPIAEGVINALMNKKKKDDPDAPTTPAA